MATEFASRADVETLEVLLTKIIHGTGVATKRDICEVEDAIGRDMAMLKHDLAILKQDMAEVKRLLRSLAQGK